jgi:hypothetical protein
VTFRVRKRDRGGSPTQLASLIRAAYPSREPDDVRFIHACHGWRRAVSDLQFRNTRPARLHNGVLTVHTATSAWFAEREFEKETLVAQLHRVAPEARVRSLRFRVGPLPQLHVGTRPPRTPAPPVAVSTLPEPLARTLANIDDDPLREAIGAAASVGLGRDARR